MKKKLITLGAFLLLGSVFLKAQETKECYKPRFKDNWFIGANVGLMPYFGNFSPIDKDDFHDEQIDKEMNLGFGINGGRQMSPVLTLRGDFVIGKSEDAKAFDRNGDPDRIKLDAAFMNFGVNALIDVINIFKYDQYRLVNPYLMLGINVGYMKGHHWNWPAGESEDVQIPNTVRDVRSIDIGGTGGLGIAFNIGEKWALNLESKAFVYNNKFDGGYTSGTKSPAMIEWYSSVGATYKFSNKKFLNEAEEYACLEKQIKSHMISGPAVDVNGAVKRAIDPLNQQIDALKNENNDLKSKVAALQNQPKPMPIYPDYVCWADVDHTPGMATESCPIPSVFFKTNSSAIDASEAAMVDKLANFIKRTPTVKTVVLEGYSDHVGTAQHNKALSQERAEAIKEALVKKGIDTKKLKVEALGETNKFSNSKIDLNRRVFFRIER